MKEKIVQQELLDFHNQSTILFSINSICSMFSVAPNITYQPLTRLWLYRWFLYIVSAFGRGWGSWGVSSSLFDDGGGGSGKFGTLGINSVTNYFFQIEFLWVNGESKVPQCGTYRNLLSHLFGKNFVKQCFY